MNTTVDPRHKKRQTVLKNLFSVAFEKGQAEKLDLIEPIKKDLTQIDQLISACAPDWPLAQINKIDLSILRLAIHELKQEETPYKVVIDEAVELAKEYGSENSAKFVNGVLGSALKKLKNTPSTTN